VEERAMLDDEKNVQETADRLDTIADVWQGLSAAKQGLGRTVDEVFDEMKAEA
jgi:hypothetical protein